MRYPDLLSFIINSSRTYLVPAANNADHHLYSMVAFCDIYRNVVTGSGLYHGGFVKFQGCKGYKRYLAEVCTDIPVEYSGYTCQRYSIHEQRDGIICIWGYDCIIGDWLHGHVLKLHRSLID